MVSTQGTLNGVLSHIHLDTCSEINCISQALLETLPGAQLQAQPIRLQNADGTPIPSLGSINLPVSIAGRTWNDNFIVARDLGVDIILGQPTLHQQQIDILNSQKLIRLQDDSGRERSIRFGTPQHLQDLMPRRIQAITAKPPKFSGILLSDVTVEIPPFTELIIPVKTCNADPAVRLDFTAYVSSTSKSSGLIYPAKGIQQLTAGYTDIMICNPTRTPRQLNSGQIIARYEAIDVNDYTLTGCDERLHPNRAVYMLAQELAAQHGSNQEDFSQLPKDLNILDATGTESDLDQSNIGKLLRLLWRYRHLFTDPEVVKATHVDKTIAEHTIEVIGNTKPIALAPYRTSPANRQVIREHIKDMLEKGVIQDSRSPWAAPVVLAPKKDGKMRFCIDYRRLNEVTKREMYALPRIDDTLDALGGAKYFTCLDLTWGYWQIPMRPEDREKTAFVTHEGQYEWLNMPFGLTNAPATFQRMMNNAFAGLTWQCCLVYLDDIIVYSRNFDDHLRDLALVFRRVDEHGLRMKPSKCHIACNKVQYLGHVLSEDGLRADPAKVKAVNNWPVPKNVTEVQSFLGLCGYYRKLIRNFAKLEKPLRDITRKNHVFHVGPLELQSFMNLKKALSEDPVLKLPDFSGVYPFEVHTDACNTGVGAVLVQHDADGNERVVAYASKNFNDTQLKWHTREHEAYAIVYALEQFRPYLLGTHFVVRTDHDSLKWLAKAPKGRLARWAMALSEFDFTIHYRKGRANANGDALSRIQWSTDTTSDTDDVYARVTDASNCGPLLVLKKGDGAAVMAVQISDIQPHEAALRIFAISTDLSLRGSILDTQASCQAMLTAIRLVQDGNPADAMLTLTSSRNSPRVLYRAPRDGTLVIDNGILCVSRANSTQILLPANATALKTRILELSHDHIMAGHLGTTKTTHRILKHYFWSNINVDVKRYVRSCLVCQVRKTPAPVKSTMTTSIPTGINSLVGIDLVGPLNCPDGTKYTYILVMTDYFSKWPTAVPLNNKEAATVAEGIFHHWYLQYGLPASIHSDQGAEFTNDLLKHLNARAGVGQEFTTPYNPSANGEVERLNRTLVDCIACYVADNPGLWHRHLNGVLFAYRTAVHNVTGYSPFYLMFGREPRVPIDILNSTSRDIYWDVKQYGTQLTKELKKAHNIVRTRLLENAKKLQRKWELAHGSEKVTTFQPGENVLMYRPRLNKLTGHPDHSAKFNPTWVGPYKVVEHRFGDDSDVYLIEDEKSQRQWSVNVNKLTKYLPRTFLGRDMSTVPATQTVEQGADLSNGHGGVDSDRAVEPAREEVATPPPGVLTTDDTLVEVETACPSEQQNATVGLGVTRQPSASLVSHRPNSSRVLRDRVRISKQELAREARRSQSVEDTTESYEDKLKSHEFNRILEHGKDGRQYYYVVEWSDSQYEPSAVWCDNVETNDAVELYWKHIPKEKRPRKFRRYPYSPRQTPARSSRAMLGGDPDE